MKRRRRRSPGHDLWMEGPVWCVVCGRWGAQRHHVVYEAHVMREKPEARWDVRNRIGLCHDHHMAHHGRSNTLPLCLLPDSVFDFATEVFGSASAAYVYLRRYYAGEDHRLDELVA